MTKEEDCKTISYIPGKLLVIVSHCDGRDGSPVERGWVVDGNQRRARGDKAQKTLFKISSEGKITKKM